VEKGLRCEKPTMLQRSEFLRLQTAADEKSTFSSQNVTFQLDSNVEASSQRKADPSTLIPPPVPVWTSISKKKGSHSCGIGATLTGSNIDRHAGIPMAKRNFRRLPFHSLKFGRCLHMSLGCVFLALEPPCPRNLVEH
jgi:hypothetical protein